MEALKVAPGLDSKNSSSPSDMGGKTLRATHGRFEPEERTANGGLQRR